MSDEPPPVSETLSWMAARDYYAGEPVHYRVREGQQASTRDIQLEPAVATALSSQGIDSLYTHQATAIDAVRAHDNTILATPTASGKSLAYVVPALERAIKQDGKTLYIAPYRALINDQAETFRTLVGAGGLGHSVGVGVQTGDVSRERRQELRRSEPNVLLVTLDQLHYSLLPYAHGSHQWRWLFEQLATVAIDEIHMYRGVFGSHAALIFRRLNRLCDYYNVEPDYVCCSATIGNPVEHAAAVTGQPSASYTLVDTDTSSSGDRHYLFWNPPLKDDANDNMDHEIDDEHPSDTVLEAQDPTGDSGPTESPTTVVTPPDDTTYAAASRKADSSGEKGSAADSDPFDITSPIDVGGGERLSNHAESVRLVADLVSKGYQTLVFTNARQGAEQNATWTDSVLRKRGQRDLAERVHAYHAGLDNARRRELETKLREGDALGVWATKALELGIDIGTLDAVILDGYPGTQMQTFQRAGRAGRGDNECLVIMVGSDNPLDQHALGNPDALFEDGAERATVNPANESILPDHVVCAADEQPLSPADEAYFGEKLSDVVTGAVSAGRLSRRNDHRIQWAATDPDVHWNTDIRDIDSREIDLIDRKRDEQLVSLEYSAAVRDAHPESVYVHQKQKYRVVDLDLDNDVAWVESTTTNDVTKAIREKEITLEDTIATQTVDLAGASMQATLSKMTVKELITGYLHFDYPDDDNPIEHRFDDPLPPSTLQTTGFHLTIPETIETQLQAQTDDEDAYLGALHAIEHTLISLLPLEVLCDRRDVGGLSILDHPQTVTGTIFVHDSFTGGAGLTRTAFESLPALLQSVRNTIHRCDCDSGCPSCIHSPHCGNGNRLLNKETAGSLLDALLV